MTDDLVERVARAIFVSSWKSSDDDDDDFEAYSDMVREACYRDARAALAIAFEEAARMAGEYWIGEDTNAYRYAQPIARSLRARAREFEVKP